MIGDRKSEIAASERLGWVCPKCCRVLSPDEIAARGDDMTGDPRSEVSASPGLISIGHWGLFKEPPRCVYEARPFPYQVNSPGIIDWSNYSMNGTQGAWCQTHGWLCPSTGRQQTP